MTFFLIIFVILLVLAAVAGFTMYMHSRTLLREQKNFERGLKMVPLLIHLPPISDDLEEGNRDARDIVDENISKAQILYSIIASSFKKNFKSKFYGQRHFAFEIIASRGVVKFYAAVPISMVELVTQAVISAYPSAQLEEVAEHNIFSPVGRISGTIGGELTLKENYAYPIATYQELKRDAMQSILNAMSNMDNKEDGAGIQILLRPAAPEWRKNASGIASKKRKGNEGKKGKDATFWWVRQIFVAPVKPPEDKSKEGGGGDKKPDLSGLDQAILDSIDEKTRYPGYEVLIRVVASSNVTQRSQSLLNSLVAAFSLFDAPGKNGFKYTAAKDIESFVTAFILRFFPPESNQNILNAIELATLFHFPDQRNIPTSQLERQASKQVDGPRNIPDEGMLLGYNVFRGAKKPIRLALEDRQRHMYVVGQTGTGKSTFLENLALQDMLSGEGFAFVDPHGDTAEKLLSMVPRERAEDVIYFSPADMDYPMGLNLFEFHTPDQRDFLIQEAINMLTKLYDPQHQGIIGPRYEHLFRNAALTVMADPAGGTFIDIPKLFNDRAFVNQKLKHVKDTTVLDFWNKEMPGSERSNEFGEVKSWLVSKFGAFLSNEMMRNIIGQPKSSFNLREIMDNKKILLVNLSKGRTGELNSKLLGMIFVMKFQAAAMSRANVPESERKDFCLYVDEFQNFSTDSFATIMSEARKYHLNLIVANQFTTQLTDEIRDAVFGNMGTIVSFRVGQSDVDTLARYFQPLFEADDLLRVPNYNTITRTLIHGVPTQSFSMATLPPLGQPNKELGDALKQLSAAKYGRPKAVVEEEIIGRLKTLGPPQGAFGQSGRPTGQMPTMGAPGQPMRPAPARPGGTGSSFLDDWLAKRQTSGDAPASGIPVSPAAPSIGPATAQAPVTNPFAAPASPATPPVSQPAGVTHASPIPSDPAGPTKNISSASTEADEVAGVAAELRSSLQSAYDHQDAEDARQREEFISLGKKHPHTTRLEDTIFIDKDDTPPTES